MRNIIRFVLLAATAAAPLTAQGWQGDRAAAGQEARQNRGDFRSDRQDARSDNRPRPGGTDAAGPIARGDRGDGGNAWADRRDTPRDRADNRGDRGFGPDRRDGRPDMQGDRRADWRSDRRDDRRDWQGDRGRDNRGGYYAGGRGDRRDGDWNRGWRNDNRYNWQGYRSTNRNLYRMPRYAAPRGYARGYTRWSPGYRPQPYFYGQNYWISDPWRYRLPPAYGGYRWVRYYDDVALVDIRSGIIADIIYSFFY